MVSCEFCGINIEKPIKVIVGGATLNSCVNCKSMGVAVENEKEFSKQHFFRKKTMRNSRENLQVISDYLATINRALAKKGFDVHHLAKGSNIKESTLSKYLSGKLSLDVTTAQKIGKFLEIKLVEIEEGIMDASDFMEKEDKKEFLNPSLGDLIKEQMNK